MKLHIALLEPEIPQNTGNIARTCAATGAELHLIQPLGFSIEEKAVRRAGLDYWDSLAVHTYSSLDVFLSSTGQSGLYLATTKARLTYCDPAYPEETCILFGKESAGLPETLLKSHPDKAIRIPMLKDRRSLNLSNSVAVIAYEVLRQWNFASLLLEGVPCSFSWSDC